MLISYFSTELWPPHIMGMDKYTIFIYVPFFSFLRHQKEKEKVSPKLERQDHLPMRLVIMFSKSVLGKIKVLQLHNIEVMHLSV